MTSLWATKQHTALFEQRIAQSVGTQPVKLSIDRSIHRSIVVNKTYWEFFEGVGSPSPSALRLCAATFWEAQSLDNLWLSLNLALIGEVTCELDGLLWGLWWSFDGHIFKYILCRPHTYIRLCQWTFDCDTVKIGVSEFTCIGNPTYA